MKQFLAHSWMYVAFRSLMVSRKGMRRFVRDYVQPGAGARILDIGCGPADILTDLPAECHYEGFDANPDYIDRAGRAFSHRDAAFTCQRVSQATLAGQGTWDLVLAIGLVHHLDDEESRQLFRLAHAALRPGGRMVTLDCVYVPDQNRMARWIIARDRGQFIRARAEYERLAACSFGDVAATVEHDLLRFPYTHLIMELSKPVSP